jgi:hypothetical protein
LLEASWLSVDDRQGLSDDSDGGDQPQPFMPVDWQPVVASGTAMRNAAVASFPKASERNMMVRPFLSEQ